jgi:hypothetical protein
LKDPLTGAKFLDLVLADPSLVEIQNVTSPITNKSFNFYTVKEQHKFAFNTGFKDSFALF